ncbi:hypothetical protein [endosymbiont of Ridgeia piscesae]|jgi:hypothetical protein|uniref:Uncharacterized protein n=1 Tax=endosymbiont of Ridgeia piscesae TaxID=54398 RepID=A0A0T5YV16_9GAMM|nr:hypothetical protein [endosymbiont of Ridgeia piscesae]KRT53957.1 hypothetical protein Ga0074115_10259 [endosymbiont of Ridgeia piscesae]KRT59164.1 hypothetical protein Ga0076813_14985 [endosymbiont of Ridgeia piscesae]
MASSRRFSPLTRLLLLIALGWSSQTVTEPLPSSSGATLYFKLPIDGLRPVSQESRIGLSLHHTLTNTPSNSSQPSPHQLSLVDWSYSAQQGPRLTMLGINPMIFNHSQLSAAERAKREQLEENLQAILIVGLGLATASGVIASSD